MGTMEKFHLTNLKVSCFPVNSFSRLLPSFMPFPSFPSSLTFCPLGKSQAPVFDVFEAFINTDNIQVFANAATDYIMCLMKFVKGLGLFHLCEAMRFLILSS